MSLKIIKNYKSNERLRASFNELAMQTFGISFEKWYQLGFWNERYVCYSYMDRDRVVSNVSASRIDIIQDGKVIPSIQIGTVMTHPEYQRRGLAAKLINEVIKEYENQCDLIFLFANLEAKGFYEKFNFKAVNETRYITNITPQKRVEQEIRKLNLENDKDLSILKRLAKDRVPITNDFSVNHAEHLLTYYCTNVFVNEIYYIEAIDTIVLYEITDHVVHLYDVVSDRKVDLQQIIQLLVNEEETKIVFHFTPNTDGLTINMKPYTTEENVFFVKSSTVTLRNNFFYPYTAHA